MNIHNAAASLHSTGLPSSSCVSNFRPKSICVSVFCPHFVAKYRPAIVYLYLCFKFQAIVYRHLCFKFQAIVYLCFSFLPTLCRLAKLSYWVLARARRDPLASAAAFISVYSFLLVKLSNFQIFSRPWPSHACPPPPPYPLPSPPFPHNSTKKISSPPCS